MSREYNGLVIGLLWFSGMPLLVLAIGLTKDFGVWPLLIWGFGWLLFIQYDEERKRRDQERNREEELLRAIEFNRKLEAAPCSHGTIGAKRDSARCPMCVHDRQQAAERARLEKQRIEKEQKQAEIAFRNQLRNKDFLRQMDPIEFERLVLELYRTAGFNVQATPTTGDQGIDGFLRRDNELMLLQCKRVKGSVGQPVVRDLYGNIKHYHVQQGDSTSVSGLLVTTGRVSRQAREWIADKPIQIVEIDELIKLIEQYLGLVNVIPASYVARVMSAPAKTTHTSRRGMCPRCGNKLRRIHGRNGVFYGCSDYPICRHTQSRR